MEFAHSPVQKPTGFETSDPQDAALPHVHLPRSYSEPEWETKKDTIKYLYLDQDMPLEDVVETLSKEYNFHTKVRMCKTRLKRWAFTKNSSKNRKSSFRHDQRPMKTQTVLNRTAKRLERRRAVEGQDESSGSIILEIDGLAGKSQFELDGPDEYNTSINAHSTSSLPFGSPVAQFTGTPQPIKDQTDEEAFNSSTDGGFVDQLQSVPAAETTVGSDYTSTTKPSVSYEEICPYRRREQKFRLIHDLGHDAKYQGDSLGEGSYISPLQERPCSTNCGCRGPHFPSAFTFLATSTEDDLSITVFSEGLRRELFAVLPEQDRPAPENRTFDALVLLKSFHRLKCHLTTLCPTTVAQSNAMSLSLEMGLLVHGCLNDARIFAGFNFDTLYSQGYLSYQLWTEFQEKRLQTNIDRLDEAFREIDEKSEATIEPEFQEPPVTKTPSTFVHHRLDGPENFFHNDVLPVPGSIDGNKRIDELARHVARFSRSGMIMIMRPVVHGVLPKNPPLRPDSTTNSSDDFFWYPIKYLDHYPILGVAYRGDLDLVQLLIEQGTDLNDNTVFTPLYAAASQGHDHVTRALLIHGASLEKDGLESLRVAARSGHTKVVRQLLEESDRMSLNDNSGLCMKQRNALFDALCSGNTETIQAFLDYEVDLDPSHRLMKVNHKSLVNAVSEGREDMVKILLQTAVDLCRQGNRGTPLSAAVANGHDSLARVLLPLAGGQVLAAVQYFRNLRQYGNTAKLLRIVAQVQRENRGRRGGVQSAVVSSNIRYLRDRFLQHHSRMVRAGLTSTTKLQDVSLHLFHYRDAWNLGITSMRKLCRGQVFPSLSETIPFLCLARGMVETLEKLGNERYMDDFTSDLQRWQMLFISPEKAADLEAYKDAMLRMWDVTIGDGTGSDFDESVLLRFQELATTLASKADLICGSSFWKSSDFPGDDAVWQDKTPAPGSTANITGHDWGGDQSSHTGDENPLLQEPKPPDPPQESSNPSLMDAIRSDLTVIDPLATFIIVGAIFAIVIIFFQVLRKLAKVSIFLSVKLPSIKTMSERYAILESELVTGRGSVRVEGVCGSEYCVF